MRWFTASGGEGKEGGTNGLYRRGVLANSVCMCVVASLIICELLALSTVAFQRPDALHTRTVHFLWAEQNATEDIIW